MANEKEAPKSEEIAAYREMKKEHQDKKSLIVAMANRYAMDPAQFFQTIKQTVFSDKNATNEHVAAFLAVAHEYGLNPFTGEIYAFPSSRGGITPIVSIDGWLKIANNREEFDGVDFEYDEDENGKLRAITCIVYRKDRNHPTRFRAKLSEYKRDTMPWKQYETTMLLHKATKGGLRYAFGFGGLYDEEEAEMINVTASSTELERATLTAQESLKEKITKEKSKETKKEEEPPEIITQVDPSPPELEFEEKPPEDNWEEEVPAPPPPPPAKPVKVGPISEKDRKEFLALCKGKGMDPAIVKAVLGDLGFATTKEITYDKYDELKRWASKWTKSN